MPLFRRGPLYLVYRSLESCYIFDSATNEVSADRPYAALVGEEGRHWLPVLDSQDVPDALRDHLILKMPSHS